jgi:hypothetical protein
VTTWIIKINTILSHSIWFFWTCKSTNDEKYIISPAKHAENTYHGSSYSRKICSNSFWHNFLLLAMGTSSKSKSKLIYAAASSRHIALGRTNQKIPQTVPVLLCVNSLLRKCVYCAVATVQKPRPVLLRQYQLPRNPVCLAAA